MTGLDPNTDAILQIYCFVTDYNLQILDRQGWGTVIHQSKTTMDGMNEWCINTHASTGLTESVLTSTTTAEEAAAGLLAYIGRFTAPREALLAGNSVHADKAFLSRPPYNRVLQHLHYRILDVSSIKEAARRWAPPEVLASVPRKKGMHEAREDILESIEEARYYRDTFFRQAA